LRKLFWQMMVSLDGFMEGPDRELDWHVVGGDFIPHVTRMLGTIDTIILGRVTYELFAGFWPTAQAPEAPAMNGLPKLVFSRTLKKVDWNNARLAKGGPAEEIGALQRQPGKDLALFGSALLRDMMDHFRKGGCRSMIVWQWLLPRHGRDQARRGRERVRR
jgi:dihydrofolate reductase